MFAEYIGVKHAVMVNSGSSANLPLSVLGLNRPRGHLRQDEVELCRYLGHHRLPHPERGARAVLVMGPSTFNLSPEEVEKA
jgi:hypothetical protein